MCWKAQSNKERQEVKLHNKNIAFFLELYRSSASTYLTLHSPQSRTHSSFWLYIQRIYIRSCMIHRFDKVSVWAETIFSHHPVPQLRLVISKWVCMCLCRCSLWQKSLLCGQVTYKTNSRCYSISYSHCLFAWEIGDPGHLTGWYVCVLVASANIQTW